MNNLNTDVSIIFVNYKTKDLTTNAINSVIEKTQGINYEIFVVDNASNDGSIEAIAKQFPNLNIIKSEINGGFGYANNLAIKHAKGKYILCLNTDTLLVNNAIKKFFDYMEQNNDCGLCGGNLLNEDGSKFNQSFKFPTLFKHYYKTDDEIFSQTKPLSVDWLSGADLFIRKSVLDEIGCFDETFFMYCEEVDLCKRIKKANYNIFFIPTAEIIHYGQGSSSPEIEINYFKVKCSANSVYHYYRKHFGKIFSVIPRIYYIYKYLNIFIKNKNPKALKALVLSQFV